MRYSIAISIVLVLLLLGSGCGIPVEEIKDTGTISGSIEIRGVPSFTKNGAKMVYIEQETSALKLYDWHTNEVRQFTFSHPVYNPKISQDGKKLFYTQLSEAGYFSELWTLDLETGRKLRLTGEENGDVYSYDIAPDGSCLAFMAFHDRENCQAISLIHLTGQPEIFPIGGDVPEIKTPGGLIQPIFSSDGKEVFFPWRKKIYVIDIPSSQVVNTINVGKPIHFLSTFSHYGVFVSLKDGYYQVFSADLGTGEVEQLTFDITNKLLPFINEDGCLYYLDTGDTLNLRKLSYLAWLTSRNSTSGFKDYRNDWGRVSWSEGYFLDFLITAFKAFSDEYFLEEFANHASSVLGSMDIKLGIRDYSGISTYGWSATRYSIDKKSRMRMVVNDGMIGVPLAEFVKLTKDEAYGPTVAEVAEEVLETLRYLVEAHDEEWREHDVDSLAITRKEEGYYIFPKGSPHWSDGINLPFNRQNRFGTLLIWLYEIDGESQYLDKALKLGRLFHRHLIPDNEGYKWYRWGGKALTGWNKGEEISTNTPSYEGHQNFDSAGYATLELEFVTKLARYGVFDDEDMQKLVNTYLNPDSTIKFFNLKAGALLSRYSEEIAKKMRKIDILGESWEHIPYLGLVLGDNGSTTWRLKKVDVAAKAERVVLFEGDNLIYFIKSGAEIAVISKAQDQLYDVKILSNRISNQEPLLLKN